MVASLGLKDSGAIASARAAEIYGLDILAQNIQVHLLLSHFLSRSPSQIVFRDLN